MSPFNDLMHKIIKAGKKTGREVKNEVNKTRSMMEIEIRSDLAHLKEDYSYLLDRQCMQIRDMYDPVGRQMLQQQISLSLSACVMVMRMQERMLVRATNAQLADGLEELSDALGMINRYYTDPGRLDQLLRNTRVKGERKKNAEMSKATDDIITTLTSQEESLIDNSRWDANVKEFIEDKIDLEEFYKRSVMEQDLHVDSGSYGAVAHGKIEYDDEEPAYWESGSKPSGIDNMSQRAASMKLSARQMRDMKQYTEQAEKIRG